jgi:hypothetical protein
MLVDPIGALTQVAARFVIFNRNDALRQMSSAVSLTTSMGNRDLPLMGPPGGASCLPVVRPLRSPRPRGGVGDRLREILRLGLDGRSLREVSTLAAMDHKTILRYVQAAQGAS